MKKKCILCFTLLSNYQNPFYVLRIEGLFIDLTDITTHAAADPGFPRGAPTYDFAKFSRKLHDIERIWGAGGGGGAPRAP